MKPPSKEARPPATANAPESNLVRETSCQTPSKSNPNTGESALTEPTVSPVGFRRLTQLARDIAEEHKISLRTAYRHLAHGTRPSSERLHGRDGKTYPAHPRGVKDRSPVERALALAQRTLNRANMNAHRDGICNADIVVLRCIVLSAQTIHNHWEAL